MNAIAFSLYGTDHKYLFGAVENARMARKHFPGWQVHVWMGSVPHRGRLGMTLHQSGAIVHVPPPDIINGMFWRFLVHDLPGVERYLCRDVDSRFSEREVKAVNEWISDGTQLHVIRDHPIFHNQLIMGGLFGWKKSPGDFEMAPLIRPWAQTVKYGQDQDFLAKEVWPRAKSRTVHDVRTNWPPEGEVFCGEYVSETGETNAQHRQSRLQKLA